MNGNDWFSCDHCGHRWCGIDEGRAVDFHANTDRFSYRSMDSALSVANGRLLSLAPHIEQVNTSLDIGGGCGSMSMCLPPRIARTSIDANRSSPEGLVSDIQFKHISLFSIDPSWKFDLVMCYHVLEHVADINYAIKIVFGASERVVAIEVPISRHVHSFNGHVHEFTRGSARRMFERDFGDFKMSWGGSGVQKPALSWIWKKA